MSECVCVFSLLQRQTEVVKELEYEISLLSNTKQILTEELEKLQRCQRTLSHCQLNARWKELRRRGSHTFSFLPLTVRFRRWRGPCPPLRPPPSTWAPRTLPALPPTPPRPPLALTLWLVGHVYLFAHTQNAGGWLKKEKE